MTRPLREWLADVAERHGLIALVRWDSREGTVLIAPAMSSTGDWIEQRGEECISEAEMARRQAELREPWEFRAELAEE